MLVVMLLILLLMLDFVRQDVVRQKGLRHGQGGVSILMSRRSSCF